MEQIEIRARGLTFPALSSGEGPLVLCLHGFPDCMRSFRHQLPAFAAAGFRAVAPALRGYAPSCQGAERDSQALEAAHDAIAIVEALGATEAHLVGHDWGAAIAYLAAALAPARFRSVATLAVPHPLGLLSALRAHPRQIALSSYMAFFQARGVAEAALGAGDFSLIEWLWKRWSPGFRAPAAEMQEVKRSLAAPGVLSHALAYYRALPRLTSLPMRTTRALLSRSISTPVLGLVGEDDGCIAAPAFEHAMAHARFAAVRCETVPGVGHFLHQEAPQALNARLLAWCAPKGPRGQQVEP